MPRSRWPGDPRRERLDLDFTGVVFVGGDFSRAQCSCGIVRFGGVEFSGGEVTFVRAEFSGGQVRFVRAEFSGGAVLFDGAKFSGGTVRFGDAKFSGGDVHFRGAKFSGSKVDFSNVGDWSHPPTFSWNGTPPPGVMLPASATDT